MGFGATALCVTFYRTICLMLKKVKHVLAFVVLTLWKNEQLCQQLEVHFKCYPDLCALKLIVYSSWAPSSGRTDTAWYAYKAPHQTKVCGKSCSACKKLCRVSRIWWKKEFQADLPCMSVWDNATTRAHARGEYF